MWTYLITSKISTIASTVINHLVPQDNSYCWQRSDCHLCLLGSWKYPFSTKFAIARWIEGKSFCRCKIAHIEIPWGNQSQKLVLCMHYHTKDMEQGQSWKILILTTKSRKSDIDHCIDTLSEINFTSYLSTISEQSGIVQHLLNVTWFCT